MLDRTSLADLQTDQGLACQAEAMRLLPTPEGFLASTQRLARSYPERLARLAVEQALLRQRAAEKFEHPERMYFTREALEQATPMAVAAHRVERFKGQSRIFDLCCGLGSDALALAEAVPVVGIDHNPLCVSLLHTNATALGLQDRVRAVVGDVLELPWTFGAADCAFFDPSRREAQRRVRRPEQYRPPLSTLLGWIDRVTGLAAKVSPAIEREALADFECEIEFVSLGGELKEATLWFGSFRTSEVRATILPGGHSLAEKPLPPGRLSQPLAYLYEPDPAVLRAGLVANLAERLGAAQLDPTIAYLTATNRLATPFARAYQVLDQFPFGRKRLQAALAALGAGSVVLKKRGSPVDTEALARQLKLRGDRTLTVILTRVAGAATALIVSPLPDEAPRGDWSSNGPVLSSPLTPLLRR